MEYQALLNTILLLRVTPGRAHIRRRAPWVALVLGFVLLSSMVLPVRCGAAPSPLGQRQVNDPPPIAVKKEMRTVRMIAFDFAGKPAASAAVSAIYTWDNTVVRKEAVADKDGGITWTEVPHVRIIIWGERVPACVLAPDETTVTTPLPPPVEMTPAVAEKPVAAQQDPSPSPAVPAKKIVRAQPESFNFRWSNPSEQEAYFIATTGFVAMGSGVEPIFVSSSLRCSASHSDLAIAQGLMLTPGCPTSLFFCASTTPPQVARLEHVYVPYPDGCRQPEIGPGVTLNSCNLSGHLPPEWPVTLTPCPQVRVHFRTRDNKPVSGVNRLALAAVGSGSMVPPAVYNFPFTLFPVPVIEQGDGSYLLTTLSPGKYRLLVDLYDATVPSPKALILDIQPGMHEQTVILPSPLIRVPSGTMLHWITSNAPSTARSLLVTAYASPMPVFGPREGLLAWWYHPTPDTLEIHQDGDRMRLLTQHAVTLETPAQSPEQPLQNIPYGLYPLLPWSPSSYVISPEPAHGVSEANFTRLPCGEKRVVDLWDAPYAYGLGWSNTPGNCLLGTVQPAQYSGTVLRMEPHPAGTASPCMRELYLNWVMDDYTPRKLQGASFIQAFFDRLGGESGQLLPQGFMAFRAGILATATTNEFAPMGESHLTLQWLGAGVIPDVAIPATIDAWHPLQLPRWQDGLTVSGHILFADGTPYAHADILIGDAHDEQHAEYFVSRTTDEDGRFSLKGVLPNTTLLILPPAAQDGRQDGQRTFHPTAAWRYQVPETAAPEMTLRFNASPTFVRLVESPRGNAWWLPDQGTPVYLSLYGNYQCPSGRGRVWYLTEESGNSACYATQLAPGDNRLVVLAPVSRSLGLIFPYDAAAGLPGAVRLEGLDALRGISEDFRVSWHPCPVLDAIVAQIDGLPEGQFRATVVTSRGLVSRMVNIGPEGGSVQLSYPALHQ